MSRTFPTWGTRALLLETSVKKVLEAPGGEKEWSKYYGVNKGVTTLAPFGCTRLDGLQRRPLFVGGDATSQLIARNAWHDATDSERGHLRACTMSYRGYKRGKHFESEGTKLLNGVVSGQEFAASGTGLKSFICTRFC